MWSVVVLAVVTVAAAVASIVNTVRHRVPRLDRPTAKRVVRSLNRGRLPDDEEDRPAALRMARFRASSHWTVVMLVGLGLMQVSLAVGNSTLPRGILYGIAVLVFASAALTLIQLMSGRLALRDADAPRA